MSRTIEQLSPGVGVWVYETESNVNHAVEYIYLGLDQNNIPRLLRKYCVAEGCMNAGGSAAYGGSEADVYLDTTGSGFLARFDADTLAALQSTTITYTDYNQSSNHTEQTISIARRCFLPSGHEIGAGGTEGGVNFLPALKTYYGTDNDLSARIARSGEGSSGIRWWTRSGANTGDFRYIYTSGSYGAVNAASSGWYRPMLAIAPGTPVSEEGADEIFLLPGTHKTFWVIDFKASLGKTNHRPKSGKLFVPSTLGENDTMTCRVCNNYGDESPEWVDCQNNEAAELGKTKTAADWEIGVHVYAETGSPKKKIFEPAMIVETEES